MARSTGPILAVGGISLVNRQILQSQPWDEQSMRIVIGTGIAAGALVLVEKASPNLATGIAWIALVTVLFVRTDPKTPTPVETFRDWWEVGKAGRRAEKKVI